jgi:phospholipid/cholesterol/gamma-HCH transport system substrate-binding protein
VEIALSARLLDKNGKVLASKLFEDSQKLDQLAPAPAVAAFSDTFDRIAKAMVGWTVQAL